MAELFIVGSARGFPVPGRGHSSLLLSSANRKILVDAGEPCSRTLIEAGISLESINAILVTHGHSDHTGGLPMLIQAMWITNRSEPLRIYLPQELSEPLEQWLNAVYIGPRFLPFDLSFTSWESNELFSICDFIVRPWETTHLESLVRRFGPNGFKAYSLKIESPQFRTLFSGDLGMPADLSPQFVSGIDWLICELAHFPPRELWDFLRDKPVRNLLLTHLAQELEEQSEQLVREARMMLSQIETIQVATDGLRISISESV